MSEATEETLLLLNEAISLGRRDGMVGQHLDAMCSARDEIERLARIGGNNPPLDIGEVDPHHLLAVPIDRLREFLELKFGHLVSKRDDLVAGADRWIAAHCHPAAQDSIAVPQIALDGNDGPDTLDFKRQLEAFTGKVVPNTKAEVKADLLQANSIIERWFVDHLAGLVENRHSVIHQAFTHYLTHLENRRTEAARQEAAKAAAAAAELAALARQVTPGPTQEALIEEAQEQLKAAQEANEALDDPEISRERGFAATLSRLKENWSWELMPDGKMALIKAVAEGKESADLLLLNESMISKIVKSKKLRRPIPGVKMKMSKGAT